MRLPIAKKIEPKAWAPLGLALAFGLYGWATFIASFHHDGVIGPHSNAPGADWIVFYEAARSYLEGNPSIIFDGPRFTALQNANFAAWLSGPLPLHPWIYPPHFLLLLLPFGLMPFGLSYVAFIGLTFAALLTVLWRCAASGERSLLIASALLCPASSLTVLTGQNAFLIAALLLGGFALLPRRPIAAGILLGVMTVKPSLALMIPVALIASREWRALAAAGATALLLVGASLVVFGPDLWLDWLRFVLACRDSGTDYAQWQEVGQLWGMSVYAATAAIGASHGTAAVAQAIAALFAGGAVYLAFSRRLAADLCLTVLCAASILAAPHVSPYDTVALGIAATAFGARTMRNATTDFATKFALLLWLIPIFNPPRTILLGAATPLLLIGIIVVIFRRQRLLTAGRHDIAAREALMP